MDWLIRLFKGVVMALGFIVPGLSGGVLAAILGLYERIIRFLAHLRTRFMADLLFFVPVGIGGIIGLVLLSRPLGWAYYNHQVATLWAFAGVIAGTLPGLTRTAAEREGRGPREWRWFIGSLIISFAAMFALREISGNVPPTFWGFLIAGAIIGLSVLVPGLSTSNLLIVIGLYHPMLDGFALRDGARTSLLGVFLPIALGAAFMLPTFSKVVERAIDRAHSRFYHVVLGLVVASTALILIPVQHLTDGLEEGIVYAGVSAREFAIAAALAAAGVLVGVWMTRMESKAAA